VNIPRATGPHQVNSQVRLVPFANHDAQVVEAEHYAVTADVSQVRLRAEPHVLVAQAAHWIHKPGSPLARRVGLAS
jgi:hypothetical protein